MTAWPVPSWVLKRASSTTLNLHDQAPAPTPACFGAGRLGGRGCTALLVSGGMLSFCLSWIASPAHGGNLDFMPLCRFSAWLRAVRVRAYLLPHRSSLLVQVLQRARGVDNVDVELGDILDAARQSRLIRNPYISILKRKYRPQLVISCIFMIFQQFDVRLLSTPWLHCGWLLSMLAVFPPNMSTTLELRAMDPGHERPLYALLHLNLVQ